LLLALMRFGLDYAQARAVGMEELLCLLYHGQLQEQLAVLDQEAARIASLQFADQHEQQRALTGLRHQAQAALDGFYRAPSSMPAPNGADNEQTRGTHQTAVSRLEVRACGDGRTDQAVAQDAAR
jgi:hypothetical protein